MRSNKYIVYVMLAIGVIPFRHARVSAESSLPFRAILLVVNSKDRTSLDLEADVAVGLETLKAADAFSSITDLYAYSIYDFQTKGDAKTLKTLNIGPTNLPKLLLVDIRNKRPVKVLWGRSVTSVRSDLNGLLTELKVQAIPDNFAITQLEADTIEKRVADKEYFLRDLEKEVRNRLKSALISVDALPDVWRPGDDRYWSPHQGVGFDNERNFLYRAAYTDYELVYPPLNTGYRERRTFRNDYSWQVDLSKAEERFSKADSKLQELEKKCEELYEIGVEEANERWRQVCSDLSGEIARARSERDRRTDFIEGLLRRYRLPSFKQAGRAVLNY